MILCCPLVPRYLYISVRGFPALPTQIRVEEVGVSAGVKPYSAGAPQLGFRQLRMIFGVADNTALIWAIWDIKLDDITPIPLVAGFTKDSGITGVFALSKQATSAIQDGRGCVIGSPGHALIQVY